MFLGCSIVEGGGEVKLQTENKKQRLGAIFITSCEDQSTPPAGSRSQGDCLATRVSVRVQHNDVGFVVVVLMFGAGVLYSCRLPDSLPRDVSAPFFALGRGGGLRTERGQASSHAAPTSARRGERAARVKVNAAELRHYSQREGWWHRYLRPESSASQGRDGRARGRHGLWRA